MTADVLECVVYATGGVMAVPVVRRLASRATGLQRLELVETEAFGRCLVLDGVMQTAESDHLLYDDAILAPLAAGDRALLVVGGGDGYVALRAADRVASLRVQVVDIDADVVALCAQHLNPRLVGHPRIAVDVDDAVAWADRHADRRFDGLVLDLTDAPLGDAAEDEARYRRTLAALVPLVAPGGWISAQAGASEVAGGACHLPSLLRGLLAPHVDGLAQRDVFVPSYGERNAFLSGRRTGAPPA